MRVSPKLRAGLLLVALIATVAAVRWADGLPDANEGAMAQTSVRPKDKRPQQQGQTQAPAQKQALDLEKLQRSAAPQPESDPFAARSFRPAPPKPKHVAAAAAAAVALPPPPPPPPPQAPPLPFIYMGRLNEDQNTTVFLTAGDRNLVVKPGDVIDNTYRIEQVTDSSVVMTYLPMNQRQTLAIGNP
jgi:hypothetical protein